MNSKVEMSRFYEDIQDAAGIAEMEQKLLSQSNLPGPRANLRVASAFADIFESNRVTNEAWKLIFTWVHLEEAEAPSDDPREYLPFCALQAMGAFFHYAEPVQKQIILESCQAAMTDSRWRVREATAMALQRIGEKDFSVIQSLFDSIGEQANALEKRAFVATLAHSPLLKDPFQVLYALQLAERILDEIAIGEVKYKAEDFRVLSRGLEYAVSLFVERSPEEGFRMLAKFAQSDDKRLRRIVKSNLGKARLAKKFSRDVERIQLLMN